MNKVTEDKMEEIISEKEAEMICFLLSQDYNLDGICLADNMVK